MKEYEVGVFEEQGGYLTISAKSPSQARKKALTIVDYEGMENARITHRDTFIVDEPKEI